MSDRERSRSRSRSRDARRRSRSPEDDYRSRRRSSSGDRQQYHNGDDNSRYSNGRRDNRFRGGGGRGGFRHYNNFNNSGGHLPAEQGTSNFQMNPDADPFQPNPNPIPPININNFPGRQQRPQQQYQQAGGFQQHRQPFQRLPPFRSTNGWSALPEDECCTLQITGIQQHVTEPDLMTHFRSFGKVVKLQFTTQDEEGTVAAHGEHKECLVQYQSPADAKKCFNSPKAVLNNRFIKLLQAPYNIVPVTEVEAYMADNPYQDEPAHRGRQPLRKPFQSHGASFGGPAAAHKFTHKQPTSWRQGDDQKPALAAPTAADQAVLTQHSEIKRLREQKQALARRKEEVVRVQILKFHGMLDKLQKSESGKGLVENLEEKIFELQRQLTELQQQQLE